MGDFDFLLLASTVTPRPSRFTRHASPVTLDPSRFTRHA